MEQHTASFSKEKTGEPFTILVVEDNYLNRRMIIKALEKNYIIKEAADAEGAAALLSRETIHLVIIDIHLGNEKKDGIWLGEQISKDYGLPFIYLTSYSETDIAHMALATQPSSYITKPFKNVDLELAIEISLQRHQSQYPEKNNWVLVKEGDFYIKLLTRSIDYIQSTGNYLHVFSGRKFYKCRSTIKQMLTQLPNDVFVQTHRAYIVNRSKVVKFNKETVVIGDEKIPVTEKYTSGLQF